MTALTLYGTQSASSLATACKLVTATGGVSANKTTKVGQIQGSGELFSLGSTATFPGTTVPTTAGVHGYLWDVNTLDLQTIASGTWTVKVNLNWNATWTTMSSTIDARVWKRSSAGAYTQIGSDMTVAGPGASTTTQTLYTLTGSSFPSMDFNLGDQLYLDIWLTVTSTGGATTRTIALWSSSSATAGIAGQVEIDTPGYAPTPGITNLVLYGSAVADTTLTTACKMAAASGGVETSKVSTSNSGSGTFMEVWSQGTTNATAVSAISAPTGHGWIYYPGAGTFAAGNWLAVITEAVTANNAGNQTLRVYKLSGGVYTAIGTILFVATNTAKTTYSPASVSMPATTFAAGDGLYFDLWYQDNTFIAGDSDTVYVSTSATAGVSNDLQVTTSSFTTSGSSVALTGQCDGIGTISGTFSLVTSLVAESDEVSVLAGSLAAAQALPSLTIAEISTINGSIQLATALANSLTGVGTLVGSLAAALTLSGTSSGGRGTITATLAATTPLVSTLTGVGTLAASVQLTSALAGTIAEIGTYTAAFSLATSLGVALAGRGTLTGVLGTTTPVALAGTLAGVGTETGTMQLGTVLTCSMAGASTLASSWVLATSLAGSAAGRGILSGTLTASLALPGRTLAGVGTLSGTLGVAGQVALNVSMSGVGTLTGTLGIAGQAALSVSMPGRGILSGALAAQTTLSGTSLVGIGTLAGTIQRQIMLTCTLVESGQLSPQLGVQTAFTSTLVGTSTAAFTLFARTSLAMQLSGTGIITTNVSYQVSLALLFAGIASLSGQLSIPILSYLSATWVTRDGQATWTAHNSLATWVTRDGQVSWKTRDEKANWQTHNEEAIWKTRS